MTQPRIRAFFDEPTKTVTYLVWDPATLHQGMKVRRGTKYILTKWFRERSAV